MEQHLRLVSVSLRAPSGRSSPKRVVRVLAGAAASLIAGLTWAAPCAPTPPPAGAVVRVTTEAELQDAVRSLVSGSTVLIADGTYDLSNTLHLDGGLRDVAIRGESGDREAVVLRGRGMRNADYGDVPHGVLISDASEVLVADLTIRDVWFHAIQLAGERGATRVTMRNLHLVDSGEQLIKASTAGPPGPYADDCIVECSLLEYSDRAPSWYTNGVDVLAGARWIVRDNLFRRIRAPIGELAGPAVLFWRNSLDTVVERNVFLECDRGIALGLSTPDANSRDGETVYDHQGGIVRNNFIHRSAWAATGDVGISVAHCRDYQILHDTVILEGSFPWTIEHRFSSSLGRIENNLTDGPILARDGATATRAGNLSTPERAWFVDQANGDLHLVRAAGPALDAVTAPSEVGDDIDGEARPGGPNADIGADELTCTTPTERVSGLRVRRMGDDLSLSWLPLSGDALYNLWYVTDPADGDRTRLADVPPAIGVLGCSEPAPAVGPSCVDRGAVSRPAALHCYRVRATCGGATEGP